MWKKIDFEREVLEHAVEEVQQVCASWRPQEHDAVELFHIQSAIYKAASLCAAKPWVVLAQTSDSVSRESGPCNKNASKGDIPRRRTRSGASRNT